MADFLIDIFSRFYYQRYFDKIQWIDRNNDGLPGKDEVTIDDAAQKLSGLYGEFYRYKLSVQASLFGNGSRHADIEISNNDYAYLLEDNSTCMNLLKDSPIYSYYDKIYLLVSYMQGMNQHRVTIVAVKKKNVVIAHSASKEPVGALSKAIEDLEHGNTPSSEFNINGHVTVVGDEAYLFPKDKVLKSVIEGGAAKIAGYDEIIIVVNRTDNYLGTFHPVSILMVKDGRVSYFNSRHESSDIAISVANTFAEFAETQ